MDSESDTPCRRDGGTEPSAWVRRFLHEIPQTGIVLDLACGSGRHSRLLIESGRPVVAVDRDLSGVADLLERPDFEALETDLEDGKPFAFAGRHFAAVIVTNYLFRPLLPALVDAVAPDGLLIYETFALGNERFGRPRSPEFLLRPGELLEIVRGRLRVLAYEDLVVSEPKPAAVQRIAARNEV